MSSQYLEGDYHIKSKQTGAYFTRYEDGTLVEEDKKGEPFTFIAFDTGVHIRRGSDPVCIIDDIVYVGSAMPTLWSVIKADAQDAWVFKDVNGSKGWWFDFETTASIAARPHITESSEPRRYPLQELFILEKA